MMDVLMNSVFMTVGPCLVIGVAFGVAALAKRNQVISFDDAKLIWTMHTKDSGCNQRKWQIIKRKKNKIVGFRCECGYEYKQKRPLFL